LASSAKEDCGGSAEEDEREKNAASTVDNPGEIRPVVGREFGRQHHLMSERKTSNELGEDEDVKSCKIGQLRRL